MTTRHLVAAFEGWRASSEPLVLATVYETEGSTYSKAGAQMLIAETGDFQGMLSGGCLEGDLGERARTVLQTGRTQSVTYDLGQNEEELWGLGVGCDGLMRIFLQPLAVADNYQPFAAMASAYASDAEETAVTVIESEHPEILSGQTIVTSCNEATHRDIVEVHAEEILVVTRRAITERRESCTVNMALDNADMTLLVARLRPPPRVLVLGAGLDAEPVVRLACELGWRVTVQDHRDAYIESGDWSGAEQVLNVVAAELDQALDLDRFAGAIVMSHHLSTDRQYLKALANRKVSYIGLLGPPDRRRRLLSELGDVGRALATTVHGPAGLDLGGRGPAAIALSIVAELHRELSERDN
jgi:xanthine/CO dehydrogenase XdhC/CoxF family maturation factor